jgi:pantoate--beta-alanine ligase
MKIITDIQEMQRLALAERSAGNTIAFVPTMGYLHEGHASLMREGRRRGKVLVASIFVNPTQFGAGEDFAAYPRDLERDSKIAAECGVDVIFAPAAAQMYPGGYQTHVEVERLSLPLCGAGRPGHFRGVTTVVAKLFNIVQPHTALFGKKDYQQLAVIRMMTSDLNIPVEIIGMPIVREADGLAMSSRNVYLSEAERSSSLCLSRSISVAREAYRAGERKTSVLKEKVLAVIGAESCANVEYADFRDGDSLEEVNKADERTLLALAVRMGKTRLIDNCILGEEN